jgi:DNA-binding response OmpR family regulator
MPRARILIVEPMRWLRESEAELLCRRGYEACPAGSLVEAIAEVSRRAPDLVLTRCQLGDGTGAELIRRLREMGIDVPIIGIAGRATTEAALRAAGAREVVRQSFDAGTLLRVVEAALKS